jgi:hypothetical protein
LIKRLLHAIRNLNRHLLSGSRSAEATEGLLREVLRKLELSEIVHSERYNDPLRLIKFGYSVHSQNDEDGIISEIFHRIGTVSKCFVEIGVEDGSETNSTALLLAGWWGTWIEASAPHVHKIRASFKGDSLEIIEKFVTPDDVDRILAKACQGA